VKVDIPRVIKALKESEDDPEAAVRSLNSEANEREAEAEALRQVAGAIRLLTLNGVEASPTPLKPSTPAADSTSEPPKGMEAVRRVMREGGVYTGRAMLEALTKRGWEPKEAKHPLATVEAAMDRLFRVKKEIDRVGRGEYTYKGLPASQDFGTLMARAEP